MIIGFLVSVKTKTALSTAICIMVLSYIADLARNIDRRIGLDRSGQPLYIGVGWKFSFIWAPLSRLHVCNAYLNILITLIISDTGKLCCQFGYVVSFYSRGTWKILIILLIPLWLFCLSFYTTLISEGYPFRTSHRPWYTLPFFAKALWARL